MKPKMAAMGTLAKHSAYVKVAEGCQHNCSFCIIPTTRGRLRSRPISSVVKEVEQLVASGVIEINLIAQDLAAYGRDRSRPLYLNWRSLRLRTAAGVERWR